MLVEVFESLIDTLKMMSLGSVVELAYVVLSQQDIFHQTPEEMGEHAKNEMTFGIK